MYVILCILTCCRDLATGRKVRQVPYNAIAANTSAFIPAQYRPDGLGLKDPRNMHKQDVEQLLLKIYELQEAAGPRSAFRFEKILSENRPVPSLYPSECDIYKEAEKGQRTKKQPKPKKKGKGRAVDVSQLPTNADENPMPDEVTEGGLATGSEVQEFTEIGSAERSDMIEAGFHEAEHVGWIAGGVPRFRVKTNIWLMYKDKAQVASAVNDLGIIDPALYHQGAYFSQVWQRQLNNNFKPRCNLLGSGTPNAN